MIIVTLELLNVKHKCTGAPSCKEASKTNRMEKILTPEEKRQIDELLKKHRPHQEERKAESQKEMTVTSNRNKEQI